MLVRPVMKMLFFPWKTKEKKARFARAPHDEGLFWVGMKTLPLRPVLVLVLVLVLVVLVPVLVLTLVVIYVFIFSIMRIVTFTQISMPARLNVQRQLHYIVNLDTIMNTVYPVAPVVQWLTSNTTINIVDVMVRISVRSFFILK